MRIRSGRSIALLLGVTVAATLPASLAGPAFAASKQAAPKKPAKLSFSPREPLDNQPITVTWKADHGPRHLYPVYFTITTGHNEQPCGSDGYVKPKRNWKKGSVVRVTFTPRDENVWCAGDAYVALYENGQIIASARLTVSDNSSTPQPDPPGQNERLSLLEGSTMTVSAPGHAERTSAVTGSLTGRLAAVPIVNGPGRPIDPGYLLLRSGSLTVAGLPTDPLCTSAGVTYPQTVGLNFTHSSVMFQTDVVYAMLTTIDGPLALTGCQGPASLAVGRPVVLASEPVEYPHRGNAPPMRMHGALGGIRLSDGADATIRLDVTAKLDLLEPGAQ